MGEYQGLLRGDTRNLHYSSYSRDEQIFQIRRIPRVQSSWCYLDDIKRYIDL